MVSDFWVVSSDLLSALDSALDSALLWDSDSVLDSALELLPEALDADEELHVLWEELEAVLLLVLPEPEELVEEEDDAPLWDVLPEDTPALDAEEELLDELLEELLLELDSLETPFPITMVRVLLLTLQSL